MISDDSKKCSNCFKVKSLTDFYRKLDKHQARCKSCNNEVVGAWRDKDRFARSKKYLTRPQAFAAFEMRW